MVQVLRKADKILETVASEEEPLTFTEICTRMRMNKATLSHILKTLVETGLLEKTNEGRYQIGPKVILLSARRRRRDVLLDVAEEQARSLAEEIGEAVTVGTLIDGERYNLAKAVVDRTIQVTAQMERRSSPYETATGRMLLACLDEGDLAGVLERKGLPGEKWPEVRSKEELVQALRDIRQTAMACWRSRDGEAEAIAVPVPGPDGRAWAAMGVALPSYRADGDRRACAIASLKDAARRMGQALAVRLGGGLK